MQRTFSSLLASGIGLTSVIIIPSSAVPVWGEVQRTQSEDVQQFQEFLQLLSQAGRQTQQQDHQEAIKTLQQALAIAEQFKNRKYQAIVLLGIGFNLNTIGQSQKALEYYNRALPIFQAEGDKTGEATILTNIGSAYQNIGQLQKALEYYNRTLPIFQTMGNRHREATTLNNIGLVYWNIGQPQKALEHYSRALAIVQALGDQNRVAITLNNIGLAYKNIGQSQKALEYYNQALPILRAMGKRETEATALNNIGEVYRSIGQQQRALEFLNQALSISRLVNDHSGEAMTLNNIGLVYRDTGQLQKALEYYNLALALPIQLKIKDRAATLSNIGIIYSDIGQPQKALEYYNQALPLQRKMEDRNGEATTLVNIGGVYHTIGQFQEALKYYNQTLPILREVGDLEGESTILSNIGFAYRDTNRFGEAIANLEQSIQLKLQIRSGLLREQRQAFVQAKQGADVALVSWLVERQQAERAYQWVNLTAIAELADYTRLLNAKVANPEAQAAIDAWNQKNKQLQSLRQQLGESYSDEQALQVRTLEADVNQAAETLARRFPETAELFETTPADIAQLQVSIPIGTTVIHPVLLTNISNVPNTIAFFILTRDQLQVVKTAVDPKAFNALLTQTSQQLNNRFDDQYLSSLADLYDQLIRPIEPQIQATQPQQLSIIATGKLRYLPFEALYDQKTEQYLIQKYPVSYLTRLSSRSLASQNQQTATATKRILAVGNPVPKAPLGLPASETEVQNIVKTIPGSEAMLREQATLAAFKLQALRFPFLHLATHGCFQKGGCPKLGLEENTILFADQRFNIADAALLGLQNVDLITLSACQTALETSSNGEEIAGLAYLFERAGAKATIASLWNAEDGTTQSLMVQFYQNLKQGMSKGEALRQAKLSQIDSHPFFWASFILIGDAR